MKPTMILTLLISCTSLMAHAQDPTIQHRFLALDFWKGKIHHVDQANPSNNWEMPWGGGVRDFQLVGQNCLLISANDGYCIYDLGSRKKVEELHNRAFNGVMTAQRRPDGSTWLGANQGTNVCIYALNATNGITQTITLGGLKWLRMMRFTPDNTLLLSEWDGATEISLRPDVPDTQRIVRRFKLPRPRNAYMALKATDGTYWVAGGYAHGLFQFGQDGSLLREFQATQPAGFTNWFYAGFQMLKNGHIIQANWTGHGAKDFKEGWKLIEFDANGTVVWHWHAAKEQVGTINGVLMLDDIVTSAHADTLYGKQDTWQATLQATRTRFIAWSAGQEHESVMHQAAELWKAASRDFPTQSRWMARDITNAASWFLKRNQPDIEHALLANQLRIMKAADESPASSQADIDILDKAKAGPDDPRWLDLYARIANHVYGRRLDLPHVGEYTPAPYREPVTPETRTLSGAESDAALERDTLFQANFNPDPDLIGHELEWTRSLARRLAAMHPSPDFSRELTELDHCQKDLADLSRAPQDTNKVQNLYLKVRRIKRAIAFKNPLLDFSRVIFVDTPGPAASGALWNHESGHRTGYNAGNGGRLLLLDGLLPGGKVTRLAPERPGAFLKPDLHFNASKVVFSFKPHDEDAYHLYEINLDGTGLRQITSGQYDDMDPCYLPDGRFVFLSARCHSYVRCLPCSPSFVVSRCDADGKNLYLLSFNNEPEYMPSLLSDGRIIYTRWEYTDKALWRVQKLWTMNPDGTSVTTFWGNQSPWPDVMTEARQIPGTQRVMFTGVGHHAWFTGCIGIINPAQGLNFPHGITKVTADRPWPECGNGPTDPVASASYHSSGAYNSYKTPYPLGDNDFLVSARNGKFRLYLMDVDGNRELIYEGEHDVLYAQPVKPRDPPNVIPDKTVWAGPQENHAAVQPGVFFSSDIFNGAPPELKKVAKYLRVIQMDPKNYSTWFKAWQHTGPVVSMLQADGVKRILGTVPIEADGSVAFKLPPGRAVHFQLLDAQFRAVHSMRSFTGLMPGEHRGCVGCHEMSSRTPAVPPSPMLAMKHGPADLTEPPWGADTSISYERFAQPVLDQYCVKCHHDSKGDKAAPNFSLRPSTVAWNHFSNGPSKFGREDDLSPFKEPYVTLLGGAFGWTHVRTNTLNERGIPTCLAGCLVVEGFPGVDARSLSTLPPMSYLSSKSPLIEHAASGKHHGVKIKDSDLLRLMAWVDVNGPFLGDEEIRQIPDPDFPGIEALPIRPLCKSAPHVNRAYSQEAFNSGDDRQRIK